MKITNTKRANETFVYSENIAEKPVCLVCEEEQGEYEYKGKPICSKCVNFIRTKY